MWRLGIKLAVLTASVLDILLPVAVILIAISWVTAVVTLTKYALQVRFVAALYIVQQKILSIGRLVEDQQ